MQPSPNFDNMLKVLSRQVPDRPTLYEFFLNDDLYKLLAGPEVCAMTDEYAQIRVMMHAFLNAGYDYVTSTASGFHFKHGEPMHLKTKSLNDGAVITDRKSFEEYVWNEPEDFGLGRLDFLEKEMPEGMKVISQGPCGVLENMIILMGYDTLAINTFEDPDLVQALSDNVGSRLLRYYGLFIDHPAIGAIVANDDWGFNRQTMLSPADMRKYVFPWHKKIVALAHEHGKPCILHSCGFFGEVIEDVIEDMNFDGRHSYEDNIMPVEDAYEQYHSRIAIMGGIDLDFVCTKTQAEIKARSRAMLERAADRGGYALGTGNSVPYYVPAENYLAMISAATEGR